ncbi:MAG: hypothetical protein AAB863_02790 [Patescibacteria group bacterium]
MGTTFNQGQLAQLSSIINIGIATALPKVAKNLDAKTTLRALEGRGQEFAGHLELALEQALNNMLVLAPRGFVVVTLAERHDPDAFYWTRSGLYVWDDFRSKIVSGARPSEAGAIFKIERFDLTRQLGDEEIERALPKSHLFGDDAVCALVASLITRQPNGEEGVLLNNGYANLFYTSSCVVYAHWSAGGRGWDIHTWGRCDFRWIADGRAFSPATGN